MDDIEQKAVIWVDDMPFDYKSLKLLKDMFDKQRKENNHMKEKIEWAIECIDSDDVEGAYDWLTEALAGK